MNDTPSDPIDEERKAVFAAWMKPIKVAATKPTSVDKLAPWRHEFASAIAAGYSWRQLAKVTAGKPELGVTLSSYRLKKAVKEAFVAANEPVPDEFRVTRKRSRTPKPAGKLQ